LGENNIIGIVSGSYPRSIIDQAINSIESEEADDIKFKSGNVIGDDSFDFNFQTLSAIASIIGVALSAIKLAISVINERRKRGEPVGIDLGKDVNKKTSGLRSSKDFRVDTRLTMLSPQSISIVTDVRSKVHLQSLEVTCNVSFEKKQFDVRIKPLKRGN
jgi:hypothetical protein